MLIKQNKTNMKEILLTVTHVTESLEQVKISRNESFCNSISQ